MGLSPTHPPVSRNSLSRSPPEEAQEGEGWAGLSLGTKLGEFPQPPHRTCDRGVAHLLDCPEPQTPKGRGSMQKDRCQSPSGCVLQALLPRGG